MGPRRVTNGICKCDVAAQVWIDLFGWSSPGRYPYSPTIATRKQQKTLGRCVLLMGPALPAVPGYGAVAAPERYTYIRTSIR